MAAVALPSAPAVSPPPAPPAPLASATAAEQAPSGFAKLLGQAQAPSGAPKAEAADSEGARLANAAPAIRNREDGSSEDGNANEATPTDATAAAPAPDAAIDPAALLAALAAAAHAAAPPSAAASPQRGAAELAPALTLPNKSAPGSGKPAATEATLPLSATQAAAFKSLTSEFTGNESYRDAQPQRAEALPDAALQAPTIKLPALAPWSAAVATGTLSATPGSPDFAAQLGAQLSTFVRDGVHHAKLELNPADMGPLTVQIRLDGNTAQVHLAAENAHTRQALEQAMPQLAGSLREAGLTLGGGGVFEQPRQPQPQPDATVAAPPNPADPAMPPALPAGLLEAAGRRRGVVDLVA